MKEIIIGLLDITTILMTLTLCKFSGKSYKMLEHLNELNIDGK